MLVLHEVAWLPIPCSKCNGEAMAMQLGKDYALACINYNSNKIGGCTSHGSFDPDLNHAIISWNNANHKEE